MNKKDEALRLALAALKRGEPVGYDTIEAIRAIDEALAQPEAPQCSSCGGFCNPKGCERENVQPSKYALLVDGAMRFATTEACREFPNTAAEHIKGLAKVVRKLEALAQPEAPTDKKDEAMDDLRQQLQEAQDMRDWYVKRCIELQKWQNKMRDPERNIVCSILANGFVSDWTAQPEAPTAQHAPKYKVSEAFLRKVCDVMAAIEDTPHYEMDVFDYAFMTLEQPEAQQAQPFAYIDLNIPRLLEQKPCVTTQLVKNKPEAIRGEKLAIYLEAPQAQQENNLPFVSEAKLHYMAEQAECVTMCLNDRGVPTTDGGEPLSLWGRVVRFAAQAQPVQPLTEVQKLDIVTNWFTDEADIARAMQMLIDFEQTTPAHGIGATTEPQRDTTDPEIQTIALQAIDTVTITGNTTIIHERGKS